MGIQTKTSSPSARINIKANGDIGANRFVNYNICQAVNGDKILGFSEAAYKSGEIASIAIGGVAVIEATGSIAFNVPIACDSQGRVKSMGVGDIQIGTSLDSISNGGYIRCIVKQ